MLYADGKKNGGSGSRLTFRPHFAPMDLDKVFDDRQPQTRPPSFPRPALIQTKKSLKNPIFFICRNSLPLVLNKKFHLSSLGLCPQGDGTPRWREP